MTTVMDEPRTKYAKGKVNYEFEQFANDYGFMVQPCIAGKPQTKAKVESPMRILDELKAYSGDYTYEELHHAHVIQITGKSYRLKDHYKEEDVVHN